MSTKIAIQNATIVNEGKSFKGSLLIEDEYIKQISEHPITGENIDQVINAEGKLLIPGVIDDQVHFREPGLTQKATIETEAKAAVAGGITSFMEMPNTVPNALTQELLENKYEIAAETSVANYSFYMGASNENIDEVLKTNPKNVCGVKVFMGSSTGNMLVDNRSVLENIFSNCDMLIATHCEDEETIRSNTQKAKEQFGENVPISQHPIIRNEEACYKSSSLAVELAKKHNTRLHVLHISTAKELELFDNNIPLEEKKITAEACIHHMWFSEEDYDKKGTFIKWNPAVKTKQDRDAILRAVVENKIDVIATDHAPHTKEEKNNDYFNAPSGGPLVQHALVAMLEHQKNDKISLEQVVHKMCHAPAILFQVEKRGFIKEGYYADLVIVDPEKQWTVSKENIHYKCGWSPFEDITFRSSVETTFVNGFVAFNNGQINSKQKGKRLTFDR